MDWYKIYRDELPGSSYNEPKQRVPEEGTSQSATEQNGAVMSATAGTEVRISWNNTIPHYTVSSTSSTSAYYYYSDTSGSFDTKKWEEVTPTRVERDPFDDFEW